MRIALLTLEALASARAVRRFVAAHAPDLALVGLSDPYRPRAGGAFGQAWTHIRRSGPRFLPYLACNFALPGLADAVRRSRPDDVDRTPLAAACRARGLSVVHIRDVNGPDFTAALSRSGAELIVSFHFDQILTAETIALTPLGAVNVHPGLLPLHRGPVPTIHALLDRPITWGVTVHRLTPRIDAGPILAQAAMADEPGLTALAAARRLHEAALPLLDRVLADLASGRSEERPVEPGSYRGFPTRTELARLARSGRRAAGVGDLAAALGLRERPR